MHLAYLLLVTGLTISAVAIYYSVVGLTAIFAAAAIPIIVMGSALEIAKLVCATWLKANWTKAPRLLKTYMVIAVAVLMLITSMGIFGFLSKAHSDQSLVSGDVTSKIAVYDEKIRTAKDNIDANRKALKQMDEAVDQVMGRSTSETGADKAVAIRRGQQKERSRLQSEIAAEQKIIAQVNDERAPIAAEVRKVEAEVGPLKYIAAFVYGANPDSNMLEKAVTWVIILIVVVFDPLAVVMLLAAQMTFGWHKEQEEQAEADKEVAVEEFFDRARSHAPQLDEEAHVVIEPFTAELPEASNDIEYQFVDEVYEPDYPQDDAPLTEEHLEQLKRSVELFKPVSGDLSSGTRFNIPVVEPLVEELVVESELDKWNRMIEEAEREVAKIAEADSVEDRLARGESYIDSEGTELTAEIPDMERPGDYVTPPDEDSKKKTYMTKDESGQLITKSRDK